MYDEIVENLEKQLPDSDMDKFKNSKVHLGIFIKPHLIYILDGKKTVESRFSKNKIAPYNQMTKNGIVIVKKG